MKIIHVRQATLKNIKAPACQKKNHRMEMVTQKNSCGLKIPSQAVLHGLPLGS